MASEQRLVTGSSGPIELFIDRPVEAPRGLALVAHPHPLFGGTADNKVVQTMARALVQLGFVSVRPNFRGIGQTAGAFDQGQGEHLDLLAVLDQLAPEIGGEVVLAGFSFGAFVQTLTAEALEKRGSPAAAMVLVGLAVTNFQPTRVPEDTLLIHGERDDTVPLAAVLDWARPQDVTVTVVPGADHFFHRRLMTIKRLVLANWRGRAWRMDDF
jgi:alpha/beta superfamily hydrolase